MTEILIDEFSGQKLILSNVTRILTTTTVPTTTTTTTTTAAPPPTTTTTVPTTTTFDIERKYNIIFIHGVQ
jgi:hypothetical protein